MKNNLYFSLAGVWFTACYILLFYDMIGGIFIGWVNQTVIYSSLLLWFLPKYLKQTPKYIICLLVFLVFSTLLHYQNPAYDKPWEKTLRWMYLMLFLVHGRKYYNSQWLFYFVISLFVVNSGIAIFERLTLTRVFHYDMELLAVHERSGYNGASYFRSFSLLGHPLYNANVTSIIMAYVLVSDYISKYMKFLLLIIGLMAIIAFNSRSSMLLWGGIMCYYFLSKYKYSFVIFAFFIILFLAQPIVNFFMDNELLGRLSGEINDSSTQTRFDSYLIFAMQDWNIDSILGGLGTINYPSTDFSLENGVLLTLGYWGWITGAYKVFVEAFVTVFINIKRMPINKIVILFTASWGVGYCNNNTFSFLFLTFLVVTIVAFNAVENKQHNHNKPYKYE